MSDVITLTPVARRVPAPPRVIALGGGKGGAGRTLLAANLGIFLSQMGKKVVVVDASLGASNLHTLFAVEPPPTNLADFLSGRVTQIEDVLRPLPGLTVKLVGGSAGLPSVPPKREAIVRFLEKLRGLDVDFILLDLESGSAPHTLDFFLAADLRVMVLIPELTSVERNYQFLASAFYRELFGPGLSSEEMVWSRRVFDRAQRESGGQPSPLDLSGELAQNDPSAASWVRRKLGRFRPYVLVNQARTTSDSRLLEGLRSVARRRYGVAVEPLGPVELDDAAWLSVRRRRPLVLEYPDSPATRTIGAIARRLVAAPAAGQVSAVALVGS